MVGGIQPDAHHPSNPQMTDHDITISNNLVSGVGTWFLGRPDTIVVGASGVIFGYLGLLLARGIVERSWWDVGVGVLIGLLYGWQLVAMLPTDERVSWQAHLCGFAGGLVAAVLFRRRRPRRVAGQPGPDTLTLPTTPVSPG